MEEKRRFERISLSQPIRYQIKGGNHFADSMGRDISAEGIGFISEEFLLKSTQLIFELRHPDRNNYIKAVGEVVWISKVPHAERFLAGARFMGPPIPVDSYF